MKKEKKSITKNDSRIGICLCPNRIHEKNPRWKLSFNMGSRDYNASLSVPYNELRPHKAYWQAYVGAKTAEEGRAGWAWAGRVGGWGRG